MDQNFNYAFKKLVGASVKEVLEKYPPGNEVDFMTRIMEDNHIVLLRALLTELDESSLESKTPACVHIFEKFQKDFNHLVIDFHKRLTEFRKLWSDRFKAASMLPTLHKFNWIEQRENKFYLVGSGDEDESHNFYKFTVKDTVAEGVRIMALFDGALSRLQEKIATQWHEETSDNQSKLIPLFESSMRTSEMNELKIIRRKLPEIFRLNFCSEVKDWREKGYSSEEELFQKMAWPWYKAYHNDNGFEGYMVFISDFIWEFIKYKVQLYENKWRILLRGITRKQALTV